MLSNANRLEVAFDEARVDLAFDEQVVREDVEAGGMVVLIGRMVNSCSARRIVAMASERVFR